MVMPAAAASCGCDKGANTLGHSGVTPAVRCYFRHGRCVHRAQPGDRQATVARRGSPVLVTPRLPAKPFLPGGITITVRTRQVHSGNGQSLAFRTHNPRRSGSISRPASRAACHIAVYPNFRGWQRAMEIHGVARLRVTRLQIYRDPSHYYWSSGPLCVLVVAMTKIRSDRVVGDRRQNWRF